MAKTIDASAAAALIHDGDSVLFGGSGSGHAVADDVIEAIVRRFQETGQPRRLWLSSIVTIGDWDDRGFSRMAIPGLVRRVVTAGFNNCPRISDLAIANEIEAYTLPQGALSQLTREMSAGRPGLITKTGLHTFVDPRLEGGKQSRCTTEDLVRLIEIDGEEYLFYRAFPVDVAIIRGTTADENGNITMEDEPYFGENFSIAATAYLHGRVVIAQVRHLAAAHSLDPKSVKVSGSMVDYIVVSPDQWQTYQTRFDPAHAGWIRRPDSAMPVLPFDIRKSIARRAAMEVFPGAVVNLGYGVSNGISQVAAEEGFYKEVVLTIEQGLMGGVPAVGKDAGTAFNYDAMFDQPYQFDFYDGGGLDIAFLSFAEVDQQGNVNVSRFGGRIGGPGGFISIAQGASKVVFSGTITTGGLDIEPDGRGGVTLKREGRSRKWVRHVEQITFSGRYALEREQEVMYVTDRAVFRLTRAGMELIEVAAGVDVGRDVLDQIEFPVRVSPDLRTMESRLFREEPMRLATEFRSRSRPQRRHVAERVACTD
jgi:propionate CoA-transferase